MMEKVKESDVEGMKPTKKYIYILKYTKPCGEEVKEIHESFPIADMDRLDDQKLLWKLEVTTQKAALERDNEKSLWKGLYC